MSVRQLAPAYDGVSSGNEQDIVSEDELVMGVGVTTDEQYAFYHG